MVCQRLRVKLKLEMQQRIHAASVICCWSLSGLTPGDLTQYNLLWQPLLQNCTVTQQLHFCTWALKSYLFTGRERVLALSICFSVVAVKEEMLFIPVLWISGNLFLVQKLFWKASVTTRNRRCQHKLFSEAKMNMQLYLKWSRLSTTVSVWLTLLYIWENRLNHFKEILGFI